MPTSAIGRAIKTDASRRPISVPCFRIRCSQWRGDYHRSAGFSLLEVLVVVFIIGILATMFTLSVGVTGGDRQLDTEVDRLIAVIALANEESVIRGREIGMRITSDGYRFATYYEGFVEYPTEDAPDQSQWMPLETSDLLGPRRLPEGIQFELSIDGREVILKSTADEKAESAMGDRAGQSDSEDSSTDETDEAQGQPEFEPQVMIFSSGDMDPFVIRLRREFSNVGTTIEFDIDGSVDVDEEDS